MSAKSLDEWLGFLEQLHPTAIDLGLQRCSEVASRLDLLSPSSTSITVAGTNGKGSTVAVMEQCLLALGRSCGAFTSPHLIDFNERIRIDGAPVPDSDIVSAFETIDEARVDISLSYFEFGALAALVIFKRHGVEFQLLEVGLGGRLDAVNIIDADVAVITSIGLDHQDWLGPDRDSIAIEKCGVAREGRVCVVGEADLPSTLLPTLESIGAKSLMIGSDFSLKEGHLYFPDSSSPYPVAIPSHLITSNAVSGLVALSAAGLEVSELVANRALSKVTIEGRLQVMNRGLVEYILDVSHNREAVDQLVSFLNNKLPQGRTIGLFAALSDKPADAMLTAMAEVIDEWHFPMGVGGARSLDPSSINTEEPLNSMLHSDFNAAWQAITVSASEQDRVVVFGSFFTVAEAISRLKAEASREAARG